MTMICLLFWSVRVFPKPNWETNRRWNQTEQTEETSGRVSFSNRSFNWMMSAALAVTALYHVFADLLNLHTVTSSPPARRPAAPVTLLTWPGSPGRLSFTFSPAEFGTRGRKKRRYWSVFKGKISRVYVWTCVKTQQWSKIWRLLFTVIKILLY